MLFFMNDEISKTYIYYDYIEYTYYIQFLESILAKYFPRISNSIFTMLPIEIVLKLVFSRV